MRIAVFVLVGVVSGANVDYTICPGKVDAFGLSSVDLTPYPVEGEKNLTVTFAGTPTKGFDKGSNAKLSVKFLGLQLSTLTFNACNDLGLVCPVVAGSKTTGSITYKVPTSIPSSLPNGIKASVELEITDQTGAAVTSVCLDAELKPGSADRVFLRGSPEPKDEEVGFEAFEQEHLERLFASWMEEHNVEPFEDPAEYSVRLQVFTDNLRSIWSHNVDGSATYKKAMNQFGIMTPEEFKLARLGYKMPADPIDVPRDVFSYPAARKQELSSSVDWVANGAVTPAKNQGNCGSCWSFSTTGGIEGALFIKTGTLVPLSEQQLVSCDTHENGCGGGLMDDAFTWIKNNGGLCSEADYPYVQKENTTVAACESTCAVQPSTGVSSYTDVEQSESALMAAVSGQPVSIAIEADQHAFQFYSSGVMTGECSTNLDHGVLVVGYGSMDGTDYWKVKNSWDTTWGVDGYILLERGKSQEGGQCGILMKASYPTLA